MTGSPHQYFDSFAEELLAKFRRVGHLVSHNPTSGDYHEEILRVVLRNFVSKRYSVKTGFVYENDTEVSNQVDVLVVDKYHASAYIYQEGDFAIVRPHATVAAIEIKTVLSATEFDKALKNHRVGEAAGHRPQRHLRHRVRLRRHHVGETKRSRRGYRHRHLRQRRLTHRMTGAPAFSLELSERKAYTSALIRMRTADLVPLVQPGAALYPLLAVSGGRYSPMGGGVPLTSESQVIAGVGVCSRTTEQDIAIVEAAMNKS